MVSDRYLEHPDITAALKTGYPRRYYNYDLPDDDENDETEESEETEWEFPS